jgi:hypothetical protein
LEGCACQENCSFGGGLEARFSTTFRISGERIDKYYLGQGNDFLGLGMKLLHNVNMSGGTSGGVQMYHDFLAYLLGVGCMQVDAQIVRFSFVMMIVQVFADTTDI